MADKEKSIINFNGTIINNGGTINGDILNPNYTFFNNKPTQEEILERLRGAIEDLRNEGVLSEDVQWYAIMRYLQDRYLAPKKKEEWLTFITKYVGEGVPSYENYRKLPSARLDAHSASWLTIGNPTEAESKQIIVMKKLLEMLG